ncbi:short-chain dehydrogenase/reductase family 16C member 6-like isoform X2 [Periplaneta americana]
MNCCEALHLLFHVLVGLLFTVVCVVGQAVYLVVPRKQKSIKGEIVLVTGAGRGLGRRLALSFGRRQAFVVCWDKDAENNQNTVWDIRQEGGQAIGFQCDVTDRKAVMDTAVLVQQQVGHVTILVNNAGIYPVKPILDWSPEELHKLFDTNLMAHFWTLKAFLPAMLERNSGHVVAVSAAAAVAPVAHELPYSASKAAVSALMDGLIQELRLQQSNKVKVSCVHPYYTASRNDLPVKFDLRIGRLSPDYVAKEIVKGVLEEREAIGVPRFMFFWICFLRCLPQSARKRWREIFYTRVWPEPVIEVSIDEKPESCAVPVPTEFVVNGKTSRIRRSGKIILAASEDVKVHLRDPGTALETNHAPGKTCSSFITTTDIFSQTDGDLPRKDIANQEEQPETQESSKL